MEVQLQLGQFHLVILLVCLTQTAIAQDYGNLISIYLKKFLVTAPQAILRLAFVGITCTYFSFQIEVDP